MIFHQPHNSLSNYNYNIAVYTDTVWDFHFHRNLELIYVQKGAVNCTVNNTSYRLTAGDFGLCLSYDVHCYQPETQAQYWVLVFSDEYIRYLSKQFAGKKGNGFSFQCSSPVRDYILQQLIDNPAPSLLTLKSCLYAVCEEYLHSVTLIDKDQKTSQIMPLLLDSILSDHTTPLTLSDLAQKLGFDYYYMSRYFRRTFNMTFTEYLNIYRLETALKLLEDTNKSIVSVAYESGFQSVRNFNNFFKKNMNMSPSQYRKKQV